MKHIVVLGAGLGGMPMAFELQALLKRDERLTVIAKGDNFHFTPSNPWVAMQWRKRADIEVAIAPVMAKKGIDFISAGAKRLHPERDEIELNDGRTVGYDYLVIATGPDLAFDEVPGLGPHGGYTRSICHVDHAEAASAAWEEFCKNPGPVVVGAAQGASCFGPAYEFAMILDTDLRKRKIRDRVPMTFVTSEPYIGHLGLGGVGDAKGLLESALRERHIRWITNAKTTKVEDGRMHVTEVDEGGKDKRVHELPFRYAMMLPAFRGIPAVAGIDGLTNPRGFILVDKHQRNAKFPNIFAVGVCIAIPPVEATPVPTGVPKTGFMIESMMTATAHNIRSLLDGQGGSGARHLERRLSGRFRRQGRRVRGDPGDTPRNVNWSSQGNWVHTAKVAFEKYFLRKIRKGISEPIYEKYILRIMGIDKLSDREHEPPRAA